MATEKIAQCEEHQTDDPEGAVHRGLTSGDDRHDEYCQRQGESHCHIDVDSPIHVSTSNASLHLHAH